MFCFYLEFSTLTHRKQKMGLHIIYILAGLGLRYL